MRHLTIEQIERLINQYIERDGEIAEVVEGSLGFGTTICFGKGLKYAVIKERFENEWSSSHVVVLYNKLPKKYEKLLDEFYNI